ncbi:MAG: TetR family transcriptional regulator [Candidatus Lokiarchaeota archaeon]|nr:TetR family transcriptional regulator [Candidatus Lokiarchaeota archaeon]MBD3343320.1 TetR family transcriptional regulator [Candidatus Lokiarchaeota archaeon]
MPKSSRSKAEIKVIKEEILSNALEIIREEGFDKLSMRKLAARSGMTAANLYNYYKNKGRLHLELDRKSYATLYAKMENASKKKNTEFEKLKAMLNAYVEFGYRFAEQYDMMFNRLRNPKSTEFIGTEDERFAKKQLREALLNLLLFRKTFSDYIKTQPKLKKKDLDILIMQIWSQLHGLISLYNSGIIGEFDEDPKRTVDRIINNLFTSIESGNV